MSLVSYAQDPLSHPSGEVDNRFSSPELEELSNVSCFRAFLAMKTVKL
jgi:hypothetical protein